MEFIKLCDAELNMYINMNRYIQVAPVFPSATLFAKLKLLGVCGFMTDLNYWRFFHSVEILTLFRKLSYYNKLLEDMKHTLCLRTDDQVCWSLLIGNNVDSFWIDNVRYYQFIIIFLINWIEFLSEKLKCNIKLMYLHLHKYKKHDVSAKAKLMVGQ